MIPAALIGIYAINRLGAVHAIVFGGFASNALAQRIDASRPVAILTSSCGIDGAKAPMSYQPLVEEAVKLSTHKPSKILVWQREQLPWSPINEGGGERDWAALVKGAKTRGVKADCVPVKSTDPIYIIHTSGTTGSPKGVLREAGGHAVGLHLSVSYLFDIHGPGCVMFTASDIGWVVGHSVSLKSQPCCPLILPAGPATNTPQYIVYAPLLAGAATVLYEGKPVGTPDASAFWRVVEEYGVTTMSTAPTALRAIKRDDPDNALLRRVGDRGGLRSLRGIFLAGERSEPSLVSMYHEFLGKYGARDAHVVDNWWSTESGSPITGRALAAYAGRDRMAGKKAVADAPPAIKPGSAGKPMPGFDVRIVDDEGEEVPKGAAGNIVLGMPLAPTGFRTLWMDAERFYGGYLKRFEGRWMDTGDAGRIDAEGYVHVMSRNDDVLNVSAHRLSSGKPLPNPLSAVLWRTQTNELRPPYRKHRAGHHEPPPRRGSLRRRHPRRPKGPAPLRLHHPPDPRPPHLRHPGQTRRGRDPAPGPRAGRPHRDARRHRAGARHDPQDAVRQDAAEGAEGAVGECGARGVWGGAGAVYGRGCGRGAGCEGEGEGVL